MSTYTLYYGYLLVEVLHLFLQFLQRAQFNLATPCKHQPRLATVNMAIALIFVFIKLALHDFLSKIFCYCSASCSGVYSIRTRTILYIQYLYGTC